MPIRDWKNEVWTIPNLLSLFRLVLIPVYITVYLNATESYHYGITAGILAISCLTDMIDGKIARRFNMISTLGKILDPIADKATQFALMLCLSRAYPVINALLVLFIVKEGFQLIAGVVNLRKGQMLDGALFSGKLCTTVLFISLILLVLLPGISPTAMWCIIGICTLVMTIAFVDYIRAYFGKNKKLHDVNEV